jgi:hypothetical protein
MIKSLLTSSSSSRGLRRSSLTTAKRSAEVWRTVVSLHNTCISPLSALPEATRPESSPSVLLQSIERTNETNQKWWWYVVAAAAGIGEWTTTRCDAQEVDDDEDDEGEKEDPYDNLSEEDEPTHCSICLTYRQGPCRPYWRKVEACTKENEVKKDDESEEGGEKEQENSEEEQPDPPCLKYMLPWIECATGYRNLYNLIELDTNYTMGIADLEKEATMEACWAPSAEPTVDWSAWQAYVASHPEWKLPKRDTKNSKPKVALWKTLGTDKDPELVDILASVPSTRGDGVLECAYAVDQDGNVLGFTYGTKPSEAAKQTASESEEEAGKVELKIRLLPLHTRKITLAAAYTQSTTGGSAEEDPLESHIFKSRPMSLKKMGKPRGSKASTQAQSILISS